MNAPLMRLACPTCAADVHADDVHPEQGIAACRSCRAVFRLGDGSARGPAPRPDSVTVEQSAGRTVFRRRWWSLKYIALTVFLLFWFGFLAFWFRVTADAPPLRYFALIHVAAGVVVAYITLAGYFNTTTVTLDRGYLTVSHAPVPWPGGRELSTAAIQQLYCTRRQHRTKHGYTYSFRLEALLRDGRKTTLLAGLDTPEVPLFLEQQLESILRIPDRPVAGELVR